MMRWLRPGRARQKQEAVLMAMIDGPERPDVPEVAECPVEAFDALEQAVSSPEWLAHLEACQQRRRGQEPEGEDGVVVPSAESSVEDANSSSGEEQAAGASGSNSGSPDQFVVIQRADAVEAMAQYIAECLSQHPEAQNLTPRQLQDALTLTLKGLKQSRFRQLCSVGRQVYRWGALSYSALQMWQNPWLVQAVLTAIWTLSRMSIGLLR